MKSTASILLVLLVCLALLTGALAEEKTIAGQADAAASSRNAAGDNAGDAEQPEDAPAAWDVVLLIPNEKTNDVLAGENLQTAKLTAALIVNALSGSGARFSVAGTVPETDAQPAGPAVIDADSPGAVGRALAALDALPSGTGNRETTYLREKVDALAGEERQSPRLVVVLLDGKNHDGDDSKFARMANRDKTDGDDFKMVFLGLNSDDAAVRYDEKIIGQLTDNRYGKGAYFAPVGGDCADRAVRMANRALDALGLESYKSRDLRGSEEMNYAEALLQSPVFLYDAQAAEALPDTAPEETRADAAAIPQSADIVVDIPLGADAADIPQSADIVVDIPLSADAAVGAKDSDGGSADDAAGRYAVRVGEWIVSDAVPTALQAARVMWARVRPVAVALEEIGVVAQDSGDIAIRAAVLIGGKETDCIPISYTLNGERLADAVIDSDKLAEAGNYSLVARVDIGGFDIHAQAEESFKVARPPVFVGEQTRFQARDTVDAPNDYAVLEDRFALFTDPNGEGIESVEVSLSDDALSNISQKGLILRGEVGAPEKALTATMIATNAAGSSVEQQIDIVLTSVPALLSATGLEMSGLESEYAKGDDVTVALKLGSSAYNRLLNALDAAWLDHITAYVSLNGAVPEAAEGSIDGWSYRFRADSAENALRAWLTLDSIEPGDFNMDLEASAEAAFTVAAPAEAPPESPAIAEKPADGPPEESASGTEAEPTDGTEVEPTSGTEAEPLSGTEVEPTSGAEAEPTSGTEVEPTSGAEVEPSSGTEAKPTSGTEVEPTSGTEVEPSSGTEAEPTSGTEAEPANGAADKGAVAPADGPAEEAEAAPEPGSGRSSPLIDRLIDRLGAGGFAAACAGIALLIAVAALIIARAVAPRYNGVLCIRVNTGESAYESNPIDLAEWGKKTVTFGNLMGQSGLPPISTLTTGEIAERLRFKPARNGILILNKTRSLRGEARLTVSPQNPARYIVQDIQLEFTYRR